MENRDENMVKCQEFYEQFNKLREMAKEIKGYCEVDAKESIRRFEQYSKFCNKHELTPIGVVAEGALRPLIAKRNEDIAPKVVEAIKKRMDAKTSQFVDKIDSRFIQKWISRVRKEEQTNNPLPSEESDVIYADPPWTYNVNHLRGNPEKHYPTMSTEEICELNVSTSENAILFLWTTNPMLEDALRVLKAWGFKYKTNLVWVKNRIGVGFWFRGQHELLLVGVKGDVHPPTESNRFSSVLNAPTKAHSEKPLEVYELIERMYPNGKFLELFARNKREGWEAWGNEL